MRFFVVFFLFFSLGLTSIPNVRAEPIKGRDYAVLASPQPTESGKNIEVLEFFWYSCPHCYKLHPHIKAWLKRKPKDVSFRYVPAIFKSNWVPGAKTFYALEVLGERNKLHDKIYDAIHINKIDLTKEALLFDWIEKQGIDRKKFVDIYNSFSISNRSSQSSQMSKKYGLRGVPSLVVDGKYLASARRGATPQDTIRTLDKLIKIARKERAKK